MKLLEEKEQKWVHRMRPYIVRHLISVGTAAVVVVAFSGSCQGYNNIRTVGQCIDANASVGSLEEALIKQDVIEEDLLQTKVTKAMCEDLREQTPGDTLVQRLFAAHNYVQEIKLVKEAMHRAGGESAAKRTDWRFLANEPLVWKRTLVAAVEGATGAQDSAGGESAADVQYATATAGPLTGATQPQTQQAAAAVSVGEDGAASIPERLDKKEAAAGEAEASPLQAAAAARCSLEFWVLDKEVGKKVTDLYEIDPLIPKKMSHRQTKQAGLVVSRVTRKRFQEIRKKYGSVAEASESNIGCVVLSNRMKAKLIRLGEYDFKAHDLDDIRDLSSNHSTRWGWDITASQTGEQELALELSYDAIDPKSRERSEEFRKLEEPVYHGEIKVTPRQSDSTPKPRERPWWRRIFEVFGT
jgi:hypothetical protein